MTDIEQKVAVAVTNRFRRESNGLAMSDPTNKALAEKLAPWLIDRGYVNDNEYKISLTRSAKLMLDRLARKFRWMENADRHHGQEPAGCARKALRALFHPHVTCEQIFEFAEQFGRLRKKSIDSRARAKPFAAPWERNIGKSGMVATRLICASEISRIGHEMGNCLANSVYGLKYVDRARRGKVELIALHDQNGKAVALLSIAEKILEDLKASDNGRPWRHRSTLMTLLAQMKVRCGDCTDAAEIAICDELLDAKANGSCRTFKHDGTVYNVGSGFIAIAEGRHTVLLQANIAGSNLSMVVGTDGGSDSEARRYLQRRLRHHCRHDANLAAACNDAFPGIDVVMRAWRRANT